MARIRRPVARLLMAMMVFAAMGRWDGLILCVGLDGHVALEATLDAATTGTGTASKTPSAYATWCEGAEHGPCIDFAIVANPFDLRSGAAIPATFLKHEVATSDPIPDRLRPLVEVTARVWTDQPALPSVLEWRRSVVLLI